MWMLAEKSAVSSYANELSENPTVMFDWTSDFSDDDNDDELERSDTPVQQRMVVLLQFILFRSLGLAPGRVLVLIKAHLLTTFSIHHVFTISFQA